MNESKCTKCNCDNCIDNETKLCKAIEFLINAVNHGYQCDGEEYNEIVKISEETRDKRNAEIKGYMDVVIASFTGPHTFVPIKHAIVKYNTVFPPRFGTYRRPDEVKCQLLRWEKFFMIEKRGRYDFCSKERVDMTDFSILFK